MIVFLSAGLAQSTEILFSAKASYFTPADQAFKDIYGGGLKFGGAMTFSLSDRLDIYFEGSYLQKKGELSYTREETDLTIVPIFAGLRYRLSKGRFQPFFGLGAGYFSFKETNVIGEVSKGGIGFQGKAGGLMFITKSLFFEISAAYSYCRMKPADFSINIGGFEAGLGIGVIL